MPGLSIVILFLSYSYLLKFSFYKLSLGVIIESTRKKENVFLK